MMSLVQRIVLSREFTGEHEGIFMGTVWVTLVHKWYIILHFWLSRHQRQDQHMITSSNENIFRVTGHMCGELIHKSLMNSPHKGQWRGALMFSLICVWTSDWVNNGKAGDLRRHHAHYDVIVMKKRMSLIINIDAILWSFRIQHSWLRKYFLAYT